MIEISLFDFYKILIDFVKYYPDGGCQSPQTFRVFQESMGLELGVSNLGALPTEANSPFFYSKAWADKYFNPNALAFNYPIVGAINLSTRVSSLDKKGQIHCENVELVVLDIWDEACGKKKGCAGRSINQIFADTKNTLSQLLYFLGGVVLATVNGETDAKIYHKKQLDALLANSEITSFDIKKYVGTQIVSTNKDVDFFKVERKSQRIYGTSTTLKLCWQECQPFPIDFSDTKNTAMLSFESGCPNCN